MKYLKPADKERIVYSGKIIEVALQPMVLGDKNITFEYARRAPGVRLIIVKDDKMLISREYRTELETYDYRLPGGKVFDKLAQYNKYKSQDILPFARRSAKLECLEETGLIAKNIRHFKTTKAGSTIIWDLIYFIVDDFASSPDGQELGFGEDIDTAWYSFDEVKELCRIGDISEARTLGVLFQFFLQYPDGYNI